MLSIYVPIRISTMWLNSQSTVIYCTPDLLRVWSRQKNKSFFLYKQGVWQSLAYWITKKLEALGVRNPLLPLLESCLENRMQRVLVEGQSSEWEKVGSGVPQGSVWGPLLFLIYINDLTDELESCPFIFAVDTTLFEVLNDDLTKISWWSDWWLVTMNPSKTRSMTFSNKKERQNHPVLSMGGCDIEEIDVYTHLALLFKIICHGIVIYFQFMKRPLNDYIC
jgi:hypothetical protein